MNQVRFCNVKIVCNIKPVVNKCLLSDGFDSFMEEYISEQRRDVKGYQNVILVDD